LKRRKILILEGNDDIKNLNMSSDELHNIKIFSFDFYAHKSLEKLKIPHELVENYFTDYDKKLVDEKTFDFVLNWYKAIDPEKLLFVKGLSMGNLLEIEFTTYFFLVLKRVLGIQKILENEQPLEIICGRLSNYVKSLIFDEKIILTEFKTSDSSSLFFDSIEIPLSIGKKTRTLKISRKNYLKIKNVVEKATGTVYHINIKQNSFDQGSVLLLDFNAVDYSELLNELTSSGQQVILLNQRRPATWNSTSLKIVNNSKCKIVKLEQFKNGQTKREIKDLKKEHWAKFNLVFKNEEKLNEYFSINDKSFWLAIKKEFLNILKKRFDETITRIVLVDELLNKLTVSCILDWAHTGAEEKIVTFFANEKKIPIVSLQHAVYPLNEKWQKSRPVYPYLLSDEVKEAVWGTIMKNFLIKNGMKEDQIILSGSPKHDLFFKKEKDVEKKDTILIAANIFVHFNFEGNDTRVFQKLEEITKKIVKIIQSYKGKKIIVKLHPTQSYHDLKSLIKEIDPAIPIYKNENLLEVLDKSDAVISLNFSTILVDAMIRRKPTFVVLVEQQGFEEEQMIKQNSTIAVSDIKNLEIRLKDFLSNESVRKDVVKKGTEFVNKYFVNQGNASKYISKVIKK